MKVGHDGLAIDGEPFGQCIDLGAVPTRRGKCLNLIRYNFRSLRRGDRTVRSDTGSRP